MPDALTRIKQIQAILSVQSDGVFGPKSRAALEELIDEAHDAGDPPLVHHGKASSFADPADVAAFKRCKKQGHGDEYCFRFGDNGIGFTGINCAAEDVAICALPPEKWKSKYGTAAQAAGKLVAVTYNGKRVVGILGDTMPREANITNGAIIDLNPGFAKQFGVKPPFMVTVDWEWA